MTFLMTVVTDTDMRQRAVHCKSEMEAHCHTEMWADDLHEQGERVVATWYTCVADWSLIGRDNDA